MKIVFNDTQFLKDMNNIVEYSIGFLDGAKLGKPALLRSVGEHIKDLAESYIDSSARIDPSSLHHVYEWYQTGSPAARLFDIEYVVSGKGLSMNSTFRQSMSIKAGSKEPFRDKAYMMENGITVNVRPKNSEVLTFDSNGETVFTKNPVTITDPGGVNAQDGFNNTLKEFFRNYLSQSSLYSSGMAFNLKNPVAFDKNFAAGKRGGRSVGLRTGSDWISGN